MRHLLAPLILTLALAVGASPRSAGAEAPDLTLTVPPEIADSGLWGYVLPRFALKTRVRVVLGAGGDLGIEADGNGTPVFAADGVTYTLTSPDTEPARRFADWLTSEVGRRTIESFVPDAGAPRFAAHDPAAVAFRKIAFDGDAKAGEALSYAHCGRCHVVGPANRLDGIGSSPSFGVLRGLPDWAERFKAFFARNPHGAFTQVEGVTPPFPIDRPPPIAPVTMTLEDLDAILAFVSAMPPKNLGAPILHQ